MDAWLQFEDQDDLSTFVIAYLEAFAKQVKHIPFKKQHQGT